MASKADLVQNFKSALDFLLQYISPSTMAHSHFAQSQAGIRRHNSQTNLTVNLARPGHSDLLFHIDIFLSVSFFTYVGDVGEIITA